VSDEGWRRLHPLSPVVNLFPQLWVLVRSAWPLLVVWVVGGRAQSQVWSNVAILGAVFTLSSVAALVHFFTLRFRVADGRLEVSSGLLHRQVRRIDPRHAQNVEVKRNLFQRAFGLAEVRIDTASDQGAEGELSALSLADAEALALWVRGAAAARSAEAGEPPADDAPLVALSWADLAVSGAASFQPWTVIVAFGVISEVATTLDPQQTTHMGVRLGLAGLAAALFAGFAGGWIWGVGASIVRHAGFRLSLRDGVLVSAEGMFSRRQVELPVARIQRLEVEASWLQRRFGHGAVSMESAANQGPQGAVASAEVPWLDGAALDRLIVAAAPRLDAASRAACVAAVDGHLAVDAPGWTPALPITRTRAAVRGAVFGAVLGGVAWLVFGPWGLIALVASPALAAVGWLDAAQVAWRLTDSHVVVRGGLLHRTVNVIDRARLQVIELDQGPLLQRLGLASLTVVAAGAARLRLPVLPRDEALALLGALSAQVARRPRKVVTHERAGEAGPERSGSGVGGELGAVGADEHVEEDEPTAEEERQPDERREGGREQAGDEDGGDPSGA